MPQPIESVLIVGGGTAGWMAAAYLERILDPSRYQIRLVESAEVASVGVGEATVPPLVRFLDVLGVDPTDFMVECHATYKLGIRFVDWLRGAESFWHPFGPIGGSIDGVQVFHHWLRSRRAGREEGPFASYSLQALLGDRHKAPRTHQADSVVLKQGAYAYHLDAAAFADWLARLATGRGVRRIVDDVRAVVLDERGFIEHLETVNSGTLSADLYIDCTGFRGLLIEDALGDRLVDWSDLLLCDRAVVLRRPAGTPMPSHTTSTALSAGWVWSIPLSDRVGSGYVYSSRFVSDEDAEDELRRHLGAPDAETRRLSMRVGRRTNFWMRNCVSVGLSAGFVEPLESTGLFLIQQGLELLRTNFPDCDFSETLIGHYNRQMGAVFDEVRDFILLHYVLSRREDTAFWRASRGVALPDALSETLALYDETGLVDWQPHVLFGETSFHAIAAGLERLPRRTLAQTDLSDFSKANEILARIRARNAEVAETLPDHGRFIAELNAGARAKRTSAQD